jgi:hypothetical protein
MKKKPSRFSPYNAEAVRKVRQSIVILHFIAGGIFHPLFIFHENIRRCAAISKDNLRINEEIRAREVRVVSANNEQLGVMVLRKPCALPPNHSLTWWKSRACQAACLPYDGLRQVQV